MSTVVALDLHHVLAGVGGLVDQHVAGGGADGDEVVALLVPGELAHAGLRDGRPLVLADGLPAVEPALVLQAQLEDLYRWVRGEEHSRPPVAKCVQLLLNSIAETLLWILHPWISADIIYYTHPRRGRTKEAAVVDFGATNDKTQQPGISYFCM